MVILSLKLNNLDEEFRERMNSDHLLILPNIPPPFFSSSLPLAFDAPLHSWLFSAKNGAFTHKGRGFSLGNFKERYLRNLLPQPPSR